MGTAHKNLTWVCFSFLASIAVQLTAPLASIAVLERHKYAVRLHFNRITAIVAKYLRGDWLRATRFIFLEVGELKLLYATLQPLQLHDKLVYL